MKSLSLTSIIILTSALTGCVATNLVGIGDTNFIIHIKRHNTSLYTPIYIVKSTPEIVSKCSRNRQGQKYMFSGTQCDVGRFPPNKLTIQYAKWKPLNDIPDNYQSYMDSFGDALPASEWKTLTIHPKKIMKDVKRNKDPKGNPIFPKVIGTKGMLINLIIHDDGSIKQELSSYGYTYDLNDWH